jgi:hypothetical protein
MIVKGEILGPMKQHTMDYREILPKVVWCRGASQYDLAMHFLRYQEYYESDSPFFRGHSWDLLTYMEWYARKHGGVFTYPSDWAGFNIPARIVLEVHARGIPDPNAYDKVMLDIALTAPDGYLIGAQPDDQDVIKHECAHGLFATNADYKTKMVALVEALPQDVRERMNAELAGMGYVDLVFVDETQAYFATGLQTNMPFDAALTKPFEELFSTYWVTT